MGEEQLNKLGIPRRRFLKSVAAGAFAAPIVTSFAMDGVANAWGDTPLMSNMSLSNMSMSNMMFAEDSLAQVIVQLLQAYQGGQLTSIWLLVRASEASLAAALAAVDGRIGIALDFANRVVQDLSSYSSAGGSLQVAYQRAVYAQQILAGIVGSRP